MGSFLLVKEPGRWPFLILHLVFSHFNRVIIGISEQVYSALLLTIFYIEVCCYIVVNIFVFCANYLIQYVILGMIIWQSPEYSQMSPLGEQTMLQIWFHISDTEFDKLLPPYPEK